MGSEFRRGNIVKLDLGDGTVRVSWLDLVSLRGGEGRKGGKGLRNMMIKESPDDRFCFHVSFHSSCSITLIIYAQQEMTAFSIAIVQNCKLWPSHKRVILSLCFNYI